MSSNNTQLMKQSKAAGSDAVPRGYKMTDVGVTPKDWKVNRLGDMATRIGSGITPRGGARIYKNEGHPFVRSQNVGWGKLQLDELAFISDEIHHTFIASELSEGDVLLNITGASIGRSAVADERIAGGNVNQHVCEIRTDSRKLVPKYLNNYLLSKLGQCQIDSFQAGGNRQGLNYNQIRSFLIALPPLAEQRAIAAALSDVDSLIESLDKLIAKKRAIKQAAMQQLLTGKTRLPGFKGEWETKRMGEIGHCLRGVSYEGQADLSPFDTGSTIRLLRSNNIQSATIITNDLQFVDTARVSSQQIMQPNDILICMANGSKALVGKSGYFKVQDGYNYTFGAFMGCFRSDPQLVEPTFVYYLFQTGLYRNYISILLAGSSINNLKPNDIESMSFGLPEIAEQNAIAVVLNYMDTEIIALEQRRDKTKQIKQGMVQELLAGRIRLI
jgi:type I restriction enzyme, S subunit